MSFISNNIIVYDSISDILVEQKNICAISLSECNENDNYFDWLHIPLPNKLLHSYKIDEFNEYSKINKIIKDPQKVFDNLNHMILRMNRHLSLKHLQLKLKDLNVGCRQKNIIYQNRQKTKV